LTSAPLSQGSCEAAGNRKVVAQDIYNTNSTSSATTYTCPESSIKYDRWAEGVSAGEGHTPFNIFVYSTYNRVFM